TPERRANFDSCCGSEVFRTIPPAGRRAPASEPGVASLRGSLMMRVRRDVRSRPEGLSALTLLVPQVAADHHHAAVTADHLAVVADLLDARLDLHDSSAAA